MNHLRTILAALLLAAAPAAAQTIKTLGYNTTNGNVVAATNLTFTNSLTVATASGSSLSIGNTNLQIRRDPGSGSLVLTANANTNTFQFRSNGTLEISGPISFGSTTNAAGYAATTRTNLGGTTTGNAVFTATNAAAARNAIGLGTFSSEDGYSRLYGPGQNEVLITEDGVTVFREIDFGGTNASGIAAITRTNLGLGATNNVTFNELTVKSLTTTDPVGWALDAVQTAAATNGVLTLPDAANVLRITNANAISSVTNGRLGAFYFLLNQSGTNLVISNSATITARGATNLTLGANQSATLIATTATNATVH